MRIHDRIERRAIDALVPYARNARTHSDEQVAQIAASLREFGFTNPVLIDEAGGIVAGHGRILAAQRLGMNAVPCIVLEGLTEAQRRAYVIADNQIAMNAGWDDALLRAEIADLQAMDYDLDMLGFGDEEIAALLADDATVGDGVQDDDADDADDDIPDDPAVTVSRLGDVWALGAHRLICGDAADAGVVADLMQGERARLCFTSPTYGNQRDYTTGGIADWDALMRGVVAQLPMSDDAQVLVNLGLIHRNNEVVPYWDGWLGWMRSQGWRRFAWYVWDQGPGLPGDWVGRFAPSFEFVFHFNRQRRKPNKIVPCKSAGDLRSGTALRRKNGDAVAWTHNGRPTQDTRIPDSVIRVNRQSGKIGKGIDHPAVFPVALPQFVIEAYSDAGDLVFEPFGGSGTTMLAAQRTGRICRSVEIAPQYVDCAIRRFQMRCPGESVTLLATGQTFDQVAAARATASDNITAERIGA